MLGNPQGNNSQHVEIHDSEDEQPPQLGGENEEEELEENVEEDQEEETEQGRRGGSRATQRNPITKPSARR